MTSILFSTSCYIKGNPYNIRISIDDDSTEHFISHSDNELLTNDSSESKSDTINIGSSIRIDFELLIDKNRNSHNKNDDPIPNMITLNKLLTVKRNEKLSNESKSDYSEDISSEKKNKNHQVTSSESIQIDLNYVNISETFMWTVKRIELEIDSISGNELCLILNEYLSKLKHRPRNLLVFVNPQCGKSNGRIIYDKQVLPLFEEANINVKTIYTERANHARDYVNENSFDEYDGLISVGGDGMFSEICFSLLLKTAEKAKLDINDKNVKLLRPAIRIGVIPAGSTDAVAFGTTGHNDPITSALQILTGQSLFIDITTVHNENGFVRFMATMFAYGFFGDIIQQSNNWRVFGPLRYNLAGFFQFVRNTSYHTQLTIIQSPEKYSSKTFIDNIDQNLFRNSEKSKDISYEKIDSEKSSLPLEIKREGQYRAINCLNMPCRCEKSKYGMSPSVHLGDGSFDVIAVKRSWSMGLLRFLHNVANDGRDIDELSNVERYRATQIVIRPIVNREEDLGNWSCDGELIKANYVIISAHHQALNLFASGINIYQTEQINQQKS